MATGFKIGGEGDLDQIYVTPAEIQALRDEGRLTLQIQSQYGERRLWTWGYNLNGQLGLSSTSPRSSPVQVGSLTNWKAIILGTEDPDTSFAIKTDGSLWAWGVNALGSLGLGNTVNRSSPVQVGLLTNWASVSGGTELGVAVKTDGSLWAWGGGANGKLGLGDTTNRSSPVQVGSLSNWKHLATTNHGVLAIKTDGSLWAWGTNTSGQLGLGDAVDRSSPVQVGALTDWKSVSTLGNLTSASAAVKTDGTLWTWGANGSGQLGLGDLVERSSPVQVGSLTNWKQVAVGDEVLLAVKTDGTLWAWGYNTQGQLGLGTIVSRSSPVQVGALTDWVQVYAKQRNGAHVFAIKTDGTLWAWGYNTDGQLGLGNTAHRSSPVQVGSMTDWVAPYLRQS